MRRLLIPALVAAAVLAAAGWTWAKPDYTVGVLLGSATNVVKGGSVLINGFPSGSVADISVRDGKAYVQLALDGDHVPLHAGAKVTVAWKALLGERLVEVHDGPESNATIPSGGMLTGTMDQPMELDQVLNALDPATRAHLSSLVNGLNSTVSGNEQNIQATVKSAGPALTSLGAVLKALGSDGPAIKNLVTTLDQMTGTLAARDKDVRGVLDDLSRTTALTAQQHQQLSAALQKLPAVIDKANGTLGDVPGVADKAVPLLQDLQPATEKLPSVAKNLKPVFQDLRPLVAELRPTLDSAKTLLGYTPGLLDQAHAVVPGATSAVNYLQPAFQFLRPYTPEVASYFSLWGSAFANYDANGHYARIFGPQVGATSLNNNPGVTPPGVRQDPYPLPGAAGNQPWADAFGSQPR
ncbi:MlaD family protein [Amycolatopsis circi]|uniref:MlaD family protein n=1 Tax=Amycolatopsis circi TaxID=871959 RepID=UPI000E225842|nr:MlaD family protein [Amycolatopsis circi]